MTDTIWTKEKILHLLQTNDKAVGRALLRLLQNQTFDEQVAEDVKYRNHKGFTPYHARIGTSMAKQFQARGILTQKQVNYWRVRNKAGVMRIGIYANQLLKEVKNANR
jgi:hypothetical protein